MHTYAQSMRVLVCTEESDYNSLPRFVRERFSSTLFFFSPFDFNLFHIILMIPRCQPKRFCACFFFFYILSLCDDYACPCPRSPSPKTGLPFRSPLLPRPRVSSSSLSYTQTQWYDVVTNVPVSTTTAPTSP